MSVIQDFFGGTRPPTTQPRFLKSHKDTVKTVSLRIALFSCNLADARKNLLTGHSDVMSDSRVGS